MSPALATPLPTRRSLDALLRPRSVAVVGASTRAGTIGAEIVRNLVEAGFGGPVYPIHPTARSIHSLRCWPRLVDVPDTIDLAVVSVPRDGVLAVVDDAIAKKVGALVVVTAGFAETGAAGSALQDELVRRTRKAGIRVVGPNCLGVLSTEPGVRLNATFAPTFPPRGPIACSSQSGAVGVAVLDHARAVGLGIHQFVSVGNKADVSGNDLLEQWEHDPDARVLLLYLESFGNPRRFAAIARRVSRDKPIVVVKSGRTPAGASAASSHTGNLAGADAAVEALLTQAGVVRTTTIEEMFATAALLATQPVPRGNRVAIVTNAGGPGIMATDACAGRGLVLARLSPDTDAALRAFLPPEASLRNPVDMIASAPAPSYERALAAVLADPGVDAVIAVFVPPVVTAARDVAKAVVAASRGADKPVLACLMGAFGVAEASALLRAQGVPVYSFPEAPAVALAHAVRYGVLRARPTGAEPALAVDPQRARVALGRHLSAEPTWLPPDAVAEVLGAYGVRVPRATLAHSADEAAEAASAIAGPCAVKLVSASIAHKSDVGGVVLDVRGPDAARAAFAAIAARLDARGLGAAMDGVLVQEQVAAGVETIVGVTEDPTFGPLIAVGLGGVAVEVWRDVSFRLVPVRDVDASEMIGELRGAPLLDGLRGAPGVDRAALADVILRISRLRADVPEIVELDLNPLLPAPGGPGLIAVDARICVRVAPPADRVTR